MNVNLLYENKEWNNLQPYFDWKAIVTDLGLNALFDAAEQDVVMKNDKVMYIEHKDPYLSDTMRKVMRVPLITEEEVVYRQSILKDCIRCEGVMNELYELTGAVLRDWDKMGRKSKNAGSMDSVGALISGIHIAKRLFDGILSVKRLMDENTDRLCAPAFGKLEQELDSAWSTEQKDLIYHILEDLSFYTNAMDVKMERNMFKVLKPKIVIDCGMAEGLKLGDLKLEAFETVIKKYSNPYGIKAKLQRAVNNAGGNYITLTTDSDISANMDDLEFQIVTYVYKSISELAKECGEFLEQLHFQIAFYRGAVNLQKHMKRYQLDYCFPIVSGRDNLRFEDLKEVVMRFKQKEEIIGNSTAADGKLLLVITGANQGGKSTYLRSIGIAQVMLQCGLMVCAKRYESGLFPNFFTHFTRREDSAMNSGRLDEELHRMDRIISQMGPNSLLLLNESFASTTEKEGSMIAYDIIRALKEEGVKIITVTHLLSFATKLYEQYRDTLAESDVVFYSAERLENGMRTYKMIAHEPELTSFGLDLYRQVLALE